MANLPLINDPFVIVSQNPILDDIKSTLIGIERDELVAIVNSAASSHPSLASIAEKVLQTEAPEMQRPLSLFYYGLINIQGYLSLVGKEAKKDRTLAKRAKIKFPVRSNVTILAEKFIPLREVFYLEVGRNLVQIARREDIGTRQAALNPAYLDKATQGAFPDKKSMQNYFNLEWKAHQYVLELAGALLTIN